MKGPVQSRSSKASLVARGLAANPVKGRRNAKNKKVPDAKPGYSLYSTDSEDQASSVGRGLDRCAALLTNILDSDSKDPRKTKTVESKKVVKTRGRSSSTSVVKYVPVKGKSPVVKFKAPIVIPTASHKDQGPFTAFNYRLVASTPLLNSEERKRQHDLLERELELTHQIQQLRQHFELLQQQRSPEIQEQQKRSLQDSMLQELDEYQNRESPTPMDQGSLKHSASRNSAAVDEGMVHTTHSGKDTPHVRRSLDFSQSHDTNRNEMGTDSPREVQQTALKSPKEKSLGRPKKQVRVVSPDSDEQYKPRSRSPTRNVSFSKHGIPSEDHLSVSSKSRVSLSPVAAENQVRTLQYLARELREVIGRSDDLEVNRLLMEIEQTCSLLPYMCTPGTSSSANKNQPDLHQLKLENAQLRRNLQIAEGKIQEQENLMQNYDNMQRGQSNLSIELAACRSENASLQKQLQEEKESKENLKKEIEELEKVVSEAKEDKKRFIHILENKEQDHSKSRRSGQQEMLRLSNEMKRLKAEVESGKLSLEAAKKENVILNLSLKQKDTEVHRLNELTRSLQQSMQRVLGPGIQPNSVSKDDLLSRLELVYSKPSSDLEHRPTLSSTRSRGYQAHESRDNNTSSTQEHRPTSLDLDVPIFDNHPLVGRPSFEGFPNKTPPTHHKIIVNQTLEVSPDEPPYFSPKASLGPGAWTAGDSAYLSPEYKNKSSELSSLSSRDEEEFQRDLQSLDAEIARIQRSLRETAMRTSST